MSDRPTGEGRLYELPTHDTEQVLNREVALARLGGNANLFAKLVHLYFDDSERMLRQLHEAALRKDASVVERAAHTLKSLAANFEAIPAARVALRIEELAQAGQLDSVMDCIPELEQQFNRLDAALRSYSDEASS
jgi:HPt (histidine-containing phosphotransfer) domain-containing protein